MSKKKQKAANYASDMDFPQRVLRYLKTEQTDEAGKRGLPVAHKISDAMAAKQQSFREPADLGYLIASGKTVLFWSDQHWGHDNIIKYTAPARSEFMNAGEMDRAMLERGRDAAMAAQKKDGETPWMVFGGDIAMRDPGRVNAFLRAIPAKKWLTVGNHDFSRDDASYYRWAVDTACLGFEFSLTREQAKNFFGNGARKEEWAAEQVVWDEAPDRIRFGVCHYPMSLDLLPTDMINLHGHTHQKQSPPLRVNMSVEHLGFKPRTLDELVSPRDMKLLIARALDPKMVTDAEKDFMERLAAQRLAKGELTYSRASR